MNTSFSINVNASKLWAREFTTVINDHTIYGNNFSLLYNIDKSKDLCPRPATFLAQDMDFYSDLYLST